MTSNDPETPRFVLTLKGEVVSDVMVQPRRIRFKELKPSEKATREVFIKLRDPNEAKVTSVTIDDSRFTLKHNGGDPDRFQDDRLHYESLQNEREGDFRDPY